MYVHICMNTLEGGVLVLVGKEGRGYLYYYCK